MDVKTFTEKRLYVKYIISCTASANVQIRIGCALEGEPDHAMDNLYRADKSLEMNDVECAVLRNGS